MSDTIHERLIRLRNALKKDNVRPLLLTELDLIIKEVSGNFDMVFGDKDPMGVPIVNSATPQEKEFGLLTGLNSPHAKSLAWAKSYKQLEGTRQEYVSLSYLLYEKMGFEPAGTKKSWLNQLDRLLDVSHGDMNAINKGIDTAQKFRAEKGFTYAGPRSLTGAVSAARAEIVSEGALGKRDRKGFNFG